MPDAGAILVDGTRGPFRLAREAARAGIATVYQELLLFPELRSPRTSSSAMRPQRAGARIDWRRCAAEARALLDSLDSPRSRRRRQVVGTLSVANRQRVEIAKALSQNARILIMDEPTAALAESRRHAA